jgi:hypothetical protein
MCLTMYSIFFLDPRGKSYAMLKESTEGHAMSMNYLIFSLNLVKSNEEKHMETS